MFNELSAAFIGLMSYEQSSDKHKGKPSSLPRRKSMRCASVRKSVAQRLPGSRNPYVSLCRKNYLFCGNDDAAEDAAIIYTMMGCCKEAGADFRKWTNYFLEHIHEYDNDLSKPLDDFLPATLMERGLI